MRFFLKKRIYLIENKLSRKPKVQHGFVLKISHSIGINNKNSLPFTCTYANDRRMFFMFFPWRFQK